MHESIISITNDETKKLNIYENKLCTLKLTTLIIACSCCVLKRLSTQQDPISSIEKIYKSRNTSQTTQTSKSPLPMFPIPSYFNVGSSTVLNWYTEAITDQIKIQLNFVPKNAITHEKLCKTKQFYTAAKRCRATMHQPMKTSKYHSNSSQVCRSTIKVTKAYGLSVCLFVCFCHSCQLLTKYQSLH